MLTTYSRIVASAVALTAVLGTAAIAHAASKEEETQRICAEADQRYQELYGEQEQPAGVAIVKTYRYHFCPATLTVKAGTTVRWVNVDKRTSHSVWLKEAGKQESVRFFPEETLEIKFQDPGEYPYLCGPHWETYDMKGKVVVTE
jgi:plastocyanin